MAAQIKTVPFHGQDLAVIPHEDKLLVAIKPICENIGMQWRGQNQRILRDEVLGSVACMMHATAADGKSYKYACLPLEFLNGWLFGIDTNRIKNPEVKARVIEYKKECYQALFSYWTQGEAVNPRKRKKTEQPPKLGCLTKDQQTGIKEMVYQRVDALPQEKRAKAAITCWSALKSKFGCPYKDIATEHYTEAVSLVARLPLEGELLPAGFASENSNPELTAEMQQISRAVGRYYYKEFGNSFMDGQLILDELRQYVPRDIHGLLKQLNQVLVTGYTHADEAITRLKTTAAMLDNWRGPKSGYSEYLTRRL